MGAATNPPDTSYSSPTAASPTTCFSPSLGASLLSHHISHETFPGTSLVAQWLRLRAPNAGGPGSIPGQGTRSHVHAATKEPACYN